jgi:dehydrogenase/reductase SDR family protein 12
VINVVSGKLAGHKVALDRLQAPAQRYSGSAAFARCKRALTVLTQVWAEAWAAKGIVVNAVQPGWTDTPGVKRTLQGWHSIFRGVLRDPEQGADTAVWLAVATEAGKVSGQLFPDREPRTARLLHAQREHAGERDRLLAYLAGLTAAGIAGTAQEDNVQ